MAKFAIKVRQILSQVVIVDDDTVTTQEEAIAVAKTYDQEVGIDPDEIEDVEFIPADIPDDDPYVLTIDRGLAGEYVLPILEEGILVENDTFQVYLIWTGEGLSGEYNPKEPEDDPLLRMNIYTHIDDEPDEDFCDEPSYSACTTFSARITMDEAKKIAKDILDNLDISLAERAGLEYAQMKAREKAEDLYIKRQQSKNKEDN